MIKKILFLLLLCFSPSCFAAECVILLHGILRTHYSMNHLASFLQDQGYIVVSHSYPTTKNSIQRNADIYLPKFINECLSQNVTRIHYVTHSLGGIVLRSYMEAHELPLTGRIVMLSPPNHGSVLADKFHNQFSYKWLYGPAGQQLTTSPNSLPNRLKEYYPYDIGVITGTSHQFHPLLSKYFSGANDGTVSVKSAQLAGMKDFLKVDSNHTFIMNSTKVLAEIKAFLQEGRF